MVFIHGGSFTGGTGNEESHGPKFFLTKNIVLVTINYRVGFLGILLRISLEVNLRFNFFQDFSVLKIFHWVYQVMQALKIKLWR